MHVIKVHFCQGLVYASCMNTSAFFLPCKPGLRHSHVKEPRGGEVEQLLYLLRSWFGGISAAIKEPPVGMISQWELVVKRGLAQYNTPGSLS